MRVVVYTDEAGTRHVADRFPADLELEVLPIAGFSRSFRKKAPGAIVYFDLRVCGAERALELGGRLSNELPGSAWGAFDPGGLLADPAALFFAGGTDYLGPSFSRGRMSRTRIEEALDFAGLESQAGETEEEAAPFPGWNALEPGAYCDVRFCYAALGHQRELFESIGEKRLKNLRESFATFLADWSAEAGGIVWIKENPHCLLLFPPRDEGMNPILAALRLILDRALVGYEVFRLEMPLTFRFALHQGRTHWRKPGFTGTIVSEDVNFVFHLGAKFPGDGQVTVSEDTAWAIPHSIRDLFYPAGDFEGRSILASQRFRD